MTELETVDAETVEKAVEEMDALDVLMGATKPQVKEEFTIPKRDGLPADLKLMLGTVDNFEELSAQAEIKSVPNREERRAGMTEKTEQDTPYFLRLVVASGVKAPDLNDSRLLQHHGVRTADALIKKIMRPGEITKCAEYVMDLSGYSDDAVRRSGN
jgi:hypothetical protein